MNSCISRHERLETYMLKLLALLLSCVALNAALSDNLRLQPPMPPGLQKVALTNVQSAIRTLLVLDVSTAIQGGGGQAESIAYWCRAVADTCASMQTNGNFLPSEITNRAPTPLNIDLSGLQTSILGLYSRSYEYRGRADVPPLDFLSAIARTFTEAIREGIKQGGKAHIL